MTLRWLELEASLFDVVQDLGQSTLVFIKILTEHDDIIQVDQAGCPLQSGQGHLHEPLESGWRICQAKGHCSVLEQPMLRHKGCLGDVFRPNRDLVVG